MTMKVILKFFESILKNHTFFALDVVFFGSMNMQFLKQSGILFQIILCFLIFQKNCIPWHAWFSALSFFQLLTFTIRCYYCTLFHIYCFCSLFRPWNWYQTCLCSKVEVVITLQPQVPNFTLIIQCSIMSYVAASSTLFV